MLKLNNRTFILFAGDVTEHTRIWRNAFQGKNTDAMTTTEIADGYAEAFLAFRIKEAETKFLKPLGHTLKTFSKRPYEYDIARKLEESALELEVIVMGLDDTGAHIFTIEDPGIAVCHDDLSFCAVGIGAFHAASSYMFGRYTKISNFADCAYLTYTAKRRAEVAPGVGKQTIMIYVTPDKGAQTIEDPHVHLLKSHYDEAVAEIQKIHYMAHETVREQFALRKIP
jgi:hypothetical protein